MMDLMEKRLAYWSGFVSGAFFTAIVAWVAVIIMVLMIKL